jgi:acyl-CoA reductase-like NAD-dependent aldehyde dehydrogenase
MSSEALPLELLPLIIDNKPFISADAVTKSTYSTHLKADFVQYISATAADAIAAVDSSQRAFKSWSTSLPSTRRAILQRTAALLSEDLEQLVKLQVNETNCTEMWATNNVRWAAAHLEEVAGKITSALKGDIPVIQTQGQTALVYKRAIGPVLSIPPSVMRCNIKKLVLT